jgi:hypothetical protein
MKTPHKHAATIKAWADGEQIELLNQFTKQWQPIGTEPCWFKGSIFRIKPAPKPDVVYYGVYNPEDARTQTLELEWCFTQFNDAGDHIKLTFDGETGKLKSAEVL